MMQPQNMPPLQQPTPQPLPPPAMKAPSQKIGTVALVLAVVALVIAAIGMVAIPGPTGPAGAQGVAGAQGAEGDRGSTGSTGATGPQGPAGLACWDLNGNGTGDVPAEDINGDTVVDVSDCTGPQGIQGPPGPGTLMEFDEWAGSFVLQITCTHVTGADVTITVPSSGTIIVTAYFMIDIDHTLGTRDVPRAFVGTTTTDCPVGDPSMWLGTVGSGSSTGGYWKSGTIERIFSVTAGPYTYYMNGDMFTGQDPGDHFRFVTLVAVFYPS